ncbi:MAG: cryptochrome/photolyase family protein [Kiritimatiellae bacterium]|nr:cryptochrome/photolyase family protein [Kiritimatiellia bacterium]
MTAARAERASAPHVEVARGDAAIVFPHQLFERHPAVERGRPVVLIEDSLFFGDPHAPARFHQQKLAFHRIAMRRFEERLRRNGYAVRLIRHAAGVTAVEALSALAREGITRWWIVDPVDDWLERRIRRAARETGANVQWLDTPAFLVSNAWNDGWLDAHPRPRLADYYIAQRRERGLLLDHAGRPVGGRWSFDADNRRRWPRGRLPPCVPREALRPEDRPLAEAIAAEFSANPGRAADLWIPTDPAGARRWLGDFVEHRLAGFGPYEDAIAARHDVLCHSVLSPLLNAGLLRPGEVLEAVLEAGRSGRAPLNSVEGFVRQVLGWREFVRAMYRRYGVAMRTANHWGHRAPLPRAFYTAQTGLEPLDCAIGRLLRLGWCHHIERLMVIGAAMMMLEVAPDAVYRWFMEMCLDAYDWVMVPNVYGMSQYADGGRMATKPYFSASAYLRQMSDHVPGRWCEVWDGLFWRFVERRRAELERHPRLRMLARQFERLDRERRRRVFAAAESWRSSLS